jgi:hypothetical protein
MGLAIGYAITGLGALNFALISFQVASRRRWIKVPMTIHRRTGIALMLSAALHGAMAIILL